MGFQRGDERAAGEAGILDGAELSHADAVAVLEDRREEAAGLADLGDERVGLAQARRQRLFADHRLAGVERAHAGVEMQVRRQADVDDVDGTVREDRVEIRGGGHAGMFGGHRRAALGVEIAEGVDGVALGEAEAGGQMLGADACADDGDGSPHARPSARFWAVMARRVTRNVCSWPTAVSVRSRMSFTRFGK